MQIRLDFRSHEPIYVQLASQVKQLVVAGALKPGDQLPPVRQLALDLRVNFNTVARAYRMLDEEGVISTQQGRGTYILEQSAPAAQRRQRRQALAELARRTLEEGERLGYRADEIQQAIAGEVIRRQSHG